MQKMLVQTIKDVFNILETDNCSDNLIENALNHRLIHLTNKIKNRINHQKNSELYHNFLEQTKHTMLIHSELIKVINYLNGNSVFTIPFKGTSLSLYLYSNPIIRLSADIDLLVRAKDFYIVKGLLEELNYKPQNLVASDLSSKLLESVGGITFYNNQGIQVDLHCNVSEKRYLGKLNAKDIFDSIVTINQSGFSFNLIEDKLHCLILMLHANKHNWTKAIWLHDIYTLISKKNINLYDLHEIARKYSLESAFQNYLRLICEFYPMAKWHKDIEKIKIDRLDFVVSIFNQSQKKDLTTIKKLYNSLKMQINIAEKILYLKGFLLSPVPKDLSNNKISKTAIILGKFKRLENKIFLLAVLFTPIILILTFINLSRWQILKLFGLPKNIAKFKATDSKPVNKKLVEYLSRIVSYTANHQPYQVTCLVKAITFYQLLKLFRQPAMIVIGVEKKDQILLAHAWVKTGNIEFFKGIKNYKELTNNATGSYEYS